MIKIIPLYTLSICVSSWSGADAGRLTFAAHIITFCSVKIASLLCVNISLHVKITGNAYSGFSTGFCAVGGKVKKILIIVDYCQYPIKKKQPNYKTIIRTNIVCVARS